MLKFVTFSARNSGAKGLSFYKPKLLIMLVAADSMTVRFFRSLPTATTVAFVFKSVLIAVLIVHHYGSRCLQK